MALTTARSNSRSETSYPEDNYRLPAFTTVRGGAIFSSPAIRALRYLASLKSSSLSREQEIREAKAMTILNASARTYNQNHIAREYTAGKRRMSIYWTWSCPWESQRDLAAMDNRFSTMTEVRT